jgi:WxL domain surface cell wall-binding
MRHKIIIALALALSALTAVSAAVAGNVTATATVAAGGGGNLSFSHGATAGVTSTLDGTDQVASYTIPLSLSDIRGSGAGWNVTITSTTFNDGAGHTLASGVTSATGVTSACTAGGTCTSPTNAIGYPLTVPAAATAPAAVKLVNAAANSGMGRFTVTPTIAVTIPGNSFAAAYSSTVTLAAVSGP